MNSRNHTTFVRVIGFALGAILNYLYLQIIDKMVFNNYIFLVFFSLLFAVFVAEAVAKYKVFNLSVDAISMYFGEEKTAQTTVSGVQTILLPLLFCAVILLFQSSAAR